MQKGILVFAAVAAAGIFSVRADNLEKAPLFSTELSGKDVQFLIGWAKEGEFQAAQAKLACTRGSRLDVKSLADSVARECQSELAELKQLAEQNGVVITPQTPGDLKQELRQLALLSGSRFDQAYLAAVLQDQRNAAAALEQAMQSPVLGIRLFAARFSPDLRACILRAGRLAPAENGHPIPQFRIANPTER